MIITPKNRTPQDKIEVARRIQVYARQVEQFDHIMWLPNVAKPKGSSSEVVQDKKAD